MGLDRNGLDRKGFIFKKDRKGLEGIGREWKGKVFLN
jgi:hypothetical protein